MPFTDAFQRAFDDVAAEASAAANNGAPDRRTESAHRYFEDAPAPPTPASTSSPQMSPWLQYLVGLREAPPSETAAAPSTKRGSSHNRKAFLTSASRADGVFVHHVFSNAAEASLYVHVRSPRDFLRPKPSRSGRGDDEDGAAESWSLLPLSAVLGRVERVLQDMARQEVARRQHNASPSPWSSAAREAFSLVFWRAMLEQAFLEQYCEVSLLEIETTTAVSGCAAHSTAAATRQTVHDLYPYDYRAQPVELRHRLEEAMRALLCASAFSLHAQWEIFMTRRGPSNTLSHLLGLEVLLLWWYANPDQMPVELASAALRFPPLTHRHQQRLATSGSGGGGDGQRSSMALRAAATTNANNASLPETTVEKHLQAFLQARAVKGAAAAHEKDVSVTGGLLCPAAIFPPSYLAALRLHLSRVRHRKDTISCPLFARVLEVALSVASTSTQAWSEARTPQCEKVAAGVHDKQKGPPPPLPPQWTVSRRGREIAEALVVDWLWPVICRTSSFHPAPLPTPTVHDLLHPAASVPPYHANGAAHHHHGGSAAESDLESPECWAVLVAVVAAVAQIRAHMLPLRRAGAGSGGAHSHRSDSSGGAAHSTQVGSVARLREEFFAPAMRVLLCPVAASGGEAQAAPPSWAHLVFGRVLSCYQESGWLARDVRHQPATPAQLWERLFFSFCTTFPNVFHAGNAVTVLWVMWAMEGAASVPTTHYSTFQAMNKGRLEALQAWSDAIAPVSVVEAHHKGREEEEELSDEICSVVDMVESEMAIGSTVPHAELRQRARYVAASASENDDAAAVAEVDSRHARRSQRRSHAGASLPVCATPLPPNPPSHLCSASARSHFEDYLRASQELREEVRSVLVHIFRHYASLPVLRPTSEEASTHGNGSTAASHTTSAACFTSGAVSSEEAARLRRSGQPSFFVLLKLTHALAFFGDVFTSQGSLETKQAAATTNSTTSVQGLVPSVLQDVVPVCQPVVARYLRRLQVFTTTTSGRDGALALLTDGEVQAQLNSLSPQIGRRRLVAALLWSGLTPAALKGMQHEVGEEEYGSEHNGDDVERPAFGSGSLAWHALGSNQLPFFTVTTKSSIRSSSITETAAVSEGSDETAENAALPVVVTNTPADVAALISDVMRNLWQLAIAVPEPARVVLHLQPFAHAHRTAQKLDSRDEQRNDSSGAGEAAETEKSGPSSHVGAEMEEEAAAPEWTAAAAAAPHAEGEMAYEEEGEMDVVLNAPSHWTSEPVDTAVAEVDGSADFAGEDAAGHFDVVDGEDAANASEPSQWDAHETLRPASTKAGLEESGEVAETTSSAEAVDAAPASSHHALLQALQPALPAAQHLFYSVLEVLAWTANAQHSHEALEVPATTASSGGGLANVGSAVWCTQLLTYYNICAAAWATPLDTRNSVSDRHVFSSSSSTGTKNAVLCRPPLVMQTLLLFVQTCPDAYLVSLLLLNLLVLRDADGRSAAQLTAQSNLPQRWQREGCMLPWTLECALAQMLYHAGVTSMVVRRWRALSADSSCSAVDDANAALRHVMVHRELVQSFAMLENEEGELDSSGNTFTSLRVTAAGSPPRSSVDGHEPHARSATTPRDFVLSIGSVLLASLQLRFRCLATHRSFYRYNVYVNEFLHNTSISSTTEKGTTDITALRVVLPSVQIISPSPSTVPPQQLQPLRHAWRGNLSGTQRGTLRRCFRGGEAAAPSLQKPSEIAAAQRAVARREDEADTQYVDAFL